MAGHSKWANIKHKKARTDAKRSKVFTRIIRELVISTRLGGPSQNDNPRLRSAVISALSANMSKDAIERAIAKGAGTTEAENVEELTYEGYAPGGIAVLVDAISENRNRTASEIRHVFSKHNGNLGTSGSVAYMFNKKGVIDFSPETKEEIVLDIAIEAGAEDVQTNDDGSITVYTSASKFSQVVNALKESNQEPAEAKITMVPDTTNTVDVETGIKHIQFIDALEDLDDVQDVYTNADIPDEVYALLSQN